MYLEEKITYNVYFRARRLCHLQAYEKEKYEKMKNNNTTGQNNFQHVSGSCL